MRFLSEASSEIPAPECTVAIFQILQNNTHTHTHTHSLSLSLALYLPRMTPSCSLSPDPSAMMAATTSWAPGTQESSSTEPVTDKLGTKYNHVAPPRKPPALPFSSLFPTRRMHDLVVKSIEWQCADLSSGPRKTTSEGVRAEDGVMGGGGDYIKPILGHSLDEKKVRDLDL